MVCSSSTMSGNYLSTCLENIFLFSSTCKTAREREISFGGKRTEPMRELSATALPQNHFQEPKLDPSGTRMPGSSSGGSCGIRDLSTGVTTYCLPEFISRKQGQNQSTQDSSWNSIWHTDISASSLIYRTTCLPLEYLPV